MKLKNNKQSLLSDETSGLLSRNISKRPVVFVLSFAVIGAAIILATQAAPDPGGVIEPEGGLRTGSVCSVSDPLASGGSAIRFGQQGCNDIFVSNSGDDSKNGSSESQAVKTIKQAVRLATDNTRIRIMAGTYIETFSIQKNNITIEPYGNGDVTINGAIPEFINGVNWTPVDSGVYKYNIGRDEANSDGNAIYGSDGQQQWSYPDLIQLRNRSTVSQLPGVYIQNFAPIAYEVHVATDTGQPPTKPLYIGGARPTVDITNANNVSIHGLSGSKLKISYGHENIQIRASSNININNVEITGGKAGIVSYDSSNLNITNNKIHGTFGRDWVWKDVKERNGTKTMENNAINIKASTKVVNNIVVDGNDISGYFNGVDYVSAGTNFIDDSAISNNRIRDNVDDGIEIDGVYRSLIIKGNTVFDSYSPLSATGGDVGPVYVYENVFVANRIIKHGLNGETSGPSYPIKMNSVEGPLSKNMHFYYNTFYFAGGTGNGRVMVQSTPTTITSNVSFTNNIFHSYDGGIIRGSGRAKDSIEWDGNVFYSEKNDTTNPWLYNYWSWNSYYDADNVNVYRSLSEIVSGGLMPSQWRGNTEGNPSFNCVDPTNTNCYRAAAAITRPSTKQPIPSGFAESSRLNSRTRVGAFE